MSEKLAPKQYMGQVRRIDMCIASKRAELEYLKELAASVSGINYSDDGVKSGYVLHDSRQARQQMRIVELEAQLSADIDRMVALRSDVNKTIDALKDKDEQLVLRYRYIETMHWEAIAERLNFDRRHVLRIHGNALQHIRYR